MILLSAIFGRICTTPIANVWLGPIGSLTPLRQYHVQDGSGGYRYSFTGPHHAKSESSSNGITQGGKSSRLPMPESCFDCWRFHVNAVRTILSSSCPFLSIVLKLSLIFLTFSAFVRIDSILYFRV